MSELVGGADDESIEGVARIQATWHGRLLLVVHIVRDWLWSDFWLAGGRGRPLGDKHERNSRASDFGERFIQDQRVVLRQPVLEQDVRHLHGDGVAGVRDERRRLEPGVE